MCKLLKVFWDLFYTYMFYTFVSTNECFEKALFGSKTPYKLIENLDVNVTYPESCIPVQINMVHRHGNRYPSGKDVHKMDVAIDKINAAFENSFDRNERLEIKDLHLPLTKYFTKTTDKLLSHVGELELYELAKRIKLRFPNIFTSQYSPLTYRFKSSCKLRCTHSSNALSIGFFEKTGVLGEMGQQPIAVETSPCNNDPVLRFFDICQKYVVQVTKNKSALKEVHEFGKRKEIQSVLEKVKLRFGLPDVDLKPVDVQSLFILCAYQIGMFGGSLNTGLCSLFDEEDRKILEYWYDLKHFYKRSAGYDITYKSSCKLLKDVYDTLLAVKETPDQSFKGVFRSAHAETIIPFYTLLGLFKDNQSLKCDNFQSMINRNFRSACSSPFSGNIYFILYRCSEGKFKIQQYVNEHLVQIPCCSSKAECDFDHFLDCYKQIIDDCNFDKLCKLNKQEL